MLIILMQWCDICSDNSEIKSLRMPHRRYNEAFGNVGDVLMPRLTQEDHTDGITRWYIVWTGD